jgi:hypothetical protein
MRQQLHALKGKMERIPYQSTSPKGQACPTSNPGWCTSDGEFPGATSRSSITQEIIVHAVIGVGIHSSPPPPNPTRTALEDHSPSFCFTSAKIFSLSYTQPRKHTHILSAIENSVQNVLTWVLDFGFLVHTIHTTSYQELWKVQEHVLRGARYRGAVA